MKYIQLRQSGMRQFNAVELLPARLVTDHGMQLARLQQRGYSSNLLHEQFTTYLKFSSSNPFANVKYTRYRFVTLCTGLCSLCKWKHCTWSTCLINLEHVIGIETLFCTVVVLIDFLILEL